MKHLNQERERKKSVNITLSNMIGMNTQHTHIYTKNRAYQVTFYQNVTFA